MKYLIKKILVFLMWIASKVYPYSLNEKLRAYQDLLYTMWIRLFIGHIGKHTIIAKPCRLQGYGQQNISIGDYTNIQSHSILGCWEKYGDQRFSPSLTIGNHCNIGEYNHITACNSITIGDGFLSGRYVYIGDNSHGGLSIEESTIPPARRSLKSRGGIEIGENVWIGDKVTILDGVIIGNNVIIGANSVVTHDIPSNSMAAGVPAKVLKHL